MKCPRCGADLTAPVKFPKLIRLHDHKQATDKYQVIEDEVVIKSPTSLRCKTSHVRIYQVIEDK